MRDQPISRFMTRNPVSVTPADTAAAAFAAMRETRCHHLPVTDNGVLVGMLGAADLVKALIPPATGDRPPNGPALLEARRVEAIMSRRLVTLRQQATLLDAVRTLARGDIHALPVVATGNVLAGIVTSTDLVEALREALVHASPEAAQAAGAAPLPASAAAAGLDSLREVYEAVGHFMHSGRGDLEHGRLLQAYQRARERVDIADPLL